MKIKDRVIGILKPGQYFFVHEVKFHDGVVVEDRFILRKLYKGRTDLSSYVEEFSLSEIKQLRNTIDKLIGVTSI